MGVTGAAGSSGAKRSPPSDGSGDSPGPPTGTASRPESPDPRGTVADWPLPELLVHIATHGLSGSLVLLPLDAPALAASSQDATLEATGDALDVIVFADGAPMRVRTSTQIAPLGEMLVRFGVIANVDLAAALSRASTAHARLGQQLIADKVIDRRLLLRALREQTLVRLRALASLPSTTRYEFHSNADLLEDGGATNAARCDPLAAIHTCVRATSDREAMESTLAAVMHQRVMLHERATPERFDLDETERAVVHRIETGPRVTYSALLTSTAAPREILRALLYSLRRTRHLVLEDEGARAWPLGVSQPRASDPVSSMRDSSMNAGLDKLRSSAIMRAVAAAEDFREAEALMRAGSLEAAEVLAHRAVERDPRQAEYQALLGYVRGLRAEKQSTPMKAAIALLSEAIVRLPRSDRALVWRAQLRHDTDPKGARADYERALALSPNNQEAQVALRGGAFRPTQGPFSSAGPRTPYATPPAPPAPPALQLLVAAPSNDVTVRKASPLQSAQDAAAWRWVALIALIAATALGAVYLLRGH